MWSSRKTFYRFVRDVIMNIRENPVEFKKEIEELLPGHRLIPDDIVILK